MKEIPDLRGNIDAHENLPRSYEGMTLEERLAYFNKMLLKAATQKGVSVGPISIDGVASRDDETKIEAIQEQLNGILDKTASASPKEIIPPNLQQIPPTTGSK